MENTENTQEKTFTGIFNSFTKKIKKSKDILGDIENLQEELSEFLEQNSAYEVVGPDNPVIIEISRALEHIDNYSATIETKDYLQKLNRNLKDGNWKTWHDLII